MTDADRQMLVDAARDAASRAYAPYSGFQVGAALLSADGRVFSGCNVENASYGAAICAERSALSQAVSAGARQFVGLAIFTDTDRATPPCGICRQSLAEFAPGLEIVAATNSAETTFTLDKLLPEAFTPDFLDKP